MGTFCHNFVSGTGKCLCELDMGGIIASKENCAGWRNTNAVNIAVINTKKICLYSCSINKKYYICDVDILNLTNTNSSLVNQATMTIFRSKRDSFTWRYCYWDHWFIPFLCCFQFSSDLELLLYKWIAIDKSDDWAIFYFLHVDHVPVLVSCLVIVCETVYSQ